MHILQTPHDMKDLANAKNGNTKQGSVLLLRCDDCVLVAAIYSSGRIWKILSKLLSPVSNCFGVFVKRETERNTI